MRAQVGKAIVTVRDRTRAMGRQVFARRSDAAQRTWRRKKAPALQKLYRGALRISAAVVGQAKKALLAVREHAVEANTALIERIERTVNLVRRVQVQTRARVFAGDVHHPGKVLSLFEPETEAIRKRKASRPTEFGKLVKIQEAEGQIITDYEVCLTRVPDPKLWEPSLKKTRGALWESTVSGDGGCRLLLGRQRETRPRAWGQTRSPPTSETSPTRAAMVPPRPALENRL